MPGLQFSDFCGGVAGAVSAPSGAGVTYFGGSWSQGTRARIRRDTHDDAVPEAVFELLALVLERCPQVEAVIFERLGNSLGRIDEQFRFRLDFARIKQIVDRATAPLVAVGDEVYAGA